MGGGANTEKRITHFSKRFFKRDMRCCSSLYKMKESDQMHASIFKTIIIYITRFDCRVGTW